MAKVKQPLLSMGMSGSVGGSLTGQRSKGQDILREKPTPKDPYSLAQAYHRWDYQDYLAQWETLPYAQKRVYAAAGSRTHNTAVGAFMQEQLSTLPDLIGRWRLDELSGAIARDTSKNSNHGTIFGASLASGLISGARYFDGINDYIGCGDDVSLDTTAEISCHAFIRPSAIGVNQVIACRDDGVNRNWELLLRVDDKLIGGIRIGGAFKYSLSASTLSVDTWYHVGFSYDGAIISLFINGLLDVPPTPQVGAIDNDDVSLSIGAREAGMDRHFHGRIDNLFLHSTAITPADFLRHSLRRYPS